MTDPTPQPEPPAETRRKSRFKTWCVRLALVVFSPLVLALLVEGIWQLIGDPRITDYDEFLATRPPHFELARFGLLRFDPDPEVSFTLRPGFDRTVAGNRYRVNEHGLRGGPVSLEKPGGTRRVLVLGDSYAFGFGVDEKDTIAAQLQVALGARHKGIECLTLGVPGYQTGQEEKVLLRDGLRLDPDVVVLVYYANDNMTPAFLYDPRIKVPYVDELPLPYGMKHFLGRSIVYSKISKAYTGVLTAQGELDSRGPRHWPTTEARLTRIAASLKERGIGFVLAAIPTLVDSIALTKKDHVFNKDHDRLMAFAKRSQIAVVDFRAILLKRNQPIELLFVSREPPDSHLTAEGYGILVRGIDERIEVAGLLR